jgi:hypothetical protein
VFLLDLAPTAPHEHPDYQYRNPMVLSGKRGVIQSFLAECVAFQAMLRIFSIWI